MHGRSMKSLLYFTFPALLTDVFLPLSFVVCQVSFPKLQLSRRAIGISQNKRYFVDADQVRAEHQAKWQ